MQVSANSCTSWSAAASAAPRNTPPTAALPTANSNMLAVRKQHYACASLHSPGTYTSTTHSSSSTNLCRSTRTWSHGRVLQSAAGSASSSTSAASLSGLDLQDSWSASGLASSITAAQLKPSLSMRPITTHVNVLLAGSGHYLGRAPYYSDESCGTASTATAKSAANDSSNASQSTTDKPQIPNASLLAEPSQDAADITAPDANNSSTPASGLHAAFLRDPVSWATQLPPVLLPEACREMIYTFQDSPGQGATLDACSHVETLLSHLLQQQLQDYKRLRGSRGMNKSLACGCLQHSTTACFYFLPPHGPSKVDLVAMSALSQHVALLPVMSLPEGASDQQAEGMLATVRQVLQEPATHVEGLPPIKLHKLTNPGLQLPLVLRAPSPASPQQPVLQSLVQLLSTDEVYGLLDNALERYSAFCDAYEAAGQDLATMAGELQGQLRLHLPSFAALQGAIKQAVESEERLADAHAAALLEQQEKTFTATELMAAVSASHGKGWRSREDAWLQYIVEVVDSQREKGEDYAYQGLKEKLLKALSH